jgi:hypothetical protein
MNTTNNILLVKWVEGEVSQQELEQISAQYDIKTIAKNLDNLQDCTLDGKNVHDSWIAFEQKLSAKNQKQNLVLV